MVVMLWLIVRRTSLPTVFRQLFDIQGRTWRSTVCNHLAVGTGLWYPVSCIRNIFCSLLCHNLQLCLYSMTIATQIIHTAPLWHLLCVSSQVLCQLRSPLPHLLRFVTLLQHPQSQLQALFYHASARFTRSSPWSRNLHFLRLHFLRLHFSQRLQPRLLSL